MRAAFARSRKSNSRDKDRDQAADGNCASGNLFKTSRDTKSQQQPVKVKIKSVSVESNQTLPSIVRCPSANSYDEDATSTSGTPSGLSDKTRASSQDSLKQNHRWSSSSVKNLLSISPLRPSLSTSCLFSSTSSSNVADEVDRTCTLGNLKADTISQIAAQERDGNNVKSVGKRQPTGAALICTPTRASLTHEWRKLKTPNKCRECNLFVYFNGRECSACGFVAHKKCITMLVIKCHTPGSKQQQPQQQPLANVATATAQSMSGIGAAFLSLRNPNIRPFGNLHEHNQHLVRGHHNQVHRPIFGQPIGGPGGEHVLDFVNRFVYEIDTRGLASKGIYRVSSIKSKVDKLCNYFDQNPSNLIDLSSFHPNIIANALKLYLRKLPEPLLTNELYESFINIARRHSSPGEIQAGESGAAAAVTNSRWSPDKVDRLLDEFKRVVDRLPDTNRQMAAMILRHLRRVADMADENQMSSKNLSIIFGPTLLSANEQNKSSVAIVDSIHQARIIELMIDWAYQIFPEQHFLEDSTDEGI